MDGTSFDRLTRLLSRRLDRRRGLALASGVVAGAAGGRSASAQMGQVMPGGACFAHRDCAQRMDVSATFCLDNFQPADGPLTCCSIRDGICSSDTECCGAGLCVGGLCAGGPIFDSWTTHAAVTLHAGPDAASEPLRVIPAWSGVRAISALPVNGFITATWEGAYGWVSTDQMTFTMEGIA